MKRVILFLVAVSLVVVSFGCSNAVEDKYGEGREKQTQKADKMINDSESD